MSAELTEYLSAFVLWGHYALLSLLSLYGAHRLYHLVILRRRMRSAPDFQHDQQAYAAGENWPKVTVQLPVYNEKFVVVRLLQQVARLDYPSDRLQIQLVDDSTDESFGLAAEQIADLQSRGFNVEHVRRTDRAGFKAGGLNYAMDSATGELIAIFDADFLPRPDFLKQTVPAFRDPKVGMVQTRWSYLNRTRSLLTRLQGLMLDAHFSVEQVIRSRTGAFFNFNGTGGVWRRSTIEDAGGWQSDTLTEDMDLSYRAQARGWMFHYLDDVDCPSELPTDMAAFKAQQYRWAKGAIEVMKKVLPGLWRSKAPLHVKVEATFHLSGNIAYVLMLIDSIFFLLPAVYVRQTSYAEHWLWLDIPLFFFASFSHALYYLYAQHRLQGGVWRQLLMMPAVFAASIGLGINNSRAVIEALVGHVTGFVRTPKTGDTEAENRSVLRQKKVYQALSVGWADRLELVMGIGFTSFVIWSCLRGHYVAAPFLAVFCLGYLYIGTKSLTFRRRRLPKRVSGSDLPAAQEAAP